MEIISYELKYCERCGTLKLRPMDSGSTYCRRCEGILTRYTIPASTRNTNAAKLPILAQTPQRAISDGTAGMVK